MKEIYSISEVSQMTSMHPNTIRLYESYGYISSVPRSQNKYRMYTIKHIEQLKLVQQALSCRVLNKRIMDTIKDILIYSGQEKYDEAIQKCLTCKEYIVREEKRIEDAVKESYKLLSQQNEERKTTIVVKRKEAAKEIGVSSDVLRNWERNGLVEVEKDEYGCNYYTENSILFLKAVKLLRSADFSIMAIINMTKNYRGGGEKELERVLDSTETEEGVYYTDQLISLMENVRKMIPKLIQQLNEIKKVSNSTPPENSMIK